MDSPTKAAFLAMKKVVASRSPAACPAPAPAPAAPQSRRRRNQPGNPNPDAEVVALSPGTLMARNRFVCEVCTKGFQREQNLQLHRRGHNLPWKLKQKTTGGAPPRRKVYLCPEPTCVHHAPSRALGDLTGIKKHYSRKHGEKIYRCEKCSKKYAVLSDWKAHMKTCGTREYRCDSCTTLFSRRDSFVTHRAFCDVLAQEIAAARPPLPGSLFSRGNSQLLPHPSLISAAAPPPFRLAHPSLAAPSTSTYRPPMEAPLPSSFFLPETHGQDFHLISGHVTAPLTHTGLLEQLSDLQTHSGGSSSGGTAPAPGMFNLSYFPMASNRSNSGGDSPASSINILQGHHFNNTCSTDFSEGGFSSLLTAPPHPAAAPPHMSATALLQKAAQLGSTSSATSASLLKTFSNPKLENLHHRQLQFSGGGGLFDQDESFKNLFASIQGPPHSYANYMAPGLGNLRRSSSSEHGGSTSSGRINVAEGMTRDFLGMRAPAGSGGGGETSVDRKGGVLPPPKGPAFGGIRFK